LVKVECHRPKVVGVAVGISAHSTPLAAKLLAMSTWLVVPVSRTTVSVPLEVNSCLALSRRLVVALANPPTTIIPLLSMETTKVAVPVGCCKRSLALRMVKVLLKAHWLSVVVETGEDWMWLIVKLFILYYVGHFYGGVNITMATTTTSYITCGCCILLGQEA